MQLMKLSHNDVEVMILRIVYTPTDTKLFHLLAHDKVDNTGKCSVILQKLFCELTDFSRFNKYSHSLQTCSMPKSPEVSSRVSRMKFGDFCHLYSLKNDLWNNIYSFRRHFSGIYSTQCALFCTKHFHGSAIKVFSLKY